MYFIAKHIFGYRFRPVLLLLLWVMLSINGCSRHAKSPAEFTPSPASVMPPQLPGIQFTIQVGAFSTSVRAAAYADQLEVSGLDAYYFLDVDNLYKVRFERFDSRDAALKRSRELRSRGLIDDFFIVHPQPERGFPDFPMQLGESLVQTARRFIGTDYRWGGTSPEKGFDCSGLTMTVYRLNGLDLPRTALEQFSTGTPIPRKTLRPGDLVFFATGTTSRISHVGIYSGKGQFIHAPSRGNTIRTESMSNSYFTSRYKGARRYF